MTLTNTNEAVGVVRAAQRASLPVAISFTVETDGRLPTGETLESAINAVDFATAHGAVYFMINCAHPTHFESVLPRSASWTKRLRGLRANASMRSHQELNDSPDLDMGDPVLLGAPISRAASPPPPAHHSRRLLRHRSPACAEHQPCLPQWRARPQARGLGLS